MTGIYESDNKKSDDDLKRKGKNSKGSPRHKTQEDEHCFHNETRQNDTLPQTTKNLHPLASYRQ